MLSHWRRWREARALRRHTIPDELWQATRSAFPFLPDDARLRPMCSLFLAHKRFEGVGIKVDDAMAVAIAAQACLPVLALGLGVYAATVGIVVHPHDVSAPREQLDEHGVLHAWQEELAGEAVDGGPLMLSWAAVTHRARADEPVFNVVIHEFVHLIDLANGEADGVPPLPSAQASRHWHAQLLQAWDRFTDRIAHREPSCIDPYGREALDEFFAVASEAFFVAPRALRDEDAALYAQLAGFFRQDPADR